MSREREESALSTADIARAADRQAQPVPEAGAQPAGAMPRGDGGEQLTPLFDRQVAEDMRSHWTQIQAGFVDDPRAAVRQADELVARALQDLASGFARQRQQIEAETGAGAEQASTESLRIALRRYRSFFERLLSL